MNGKKAKIIMALGVVLVFLAGAAIGAIGMRIYVRHRIADFVGKGPPPRMVGHLMRKISAELSLSPEQQAEVRRIAESLRSELMALREKYRPEVEAIIEKQFAAIKDCLDPAQQQQADAILSRLKAHKGGPPRKRGRRGFLEALARELELSPDQMARIRPILDQSRKKREQIKQRYRDTGDRWQRRARIKQLRQETLSRLSAILSPEQMARYQAFMRQTRHRRGPPP